MASSNSVVLTSALITGVTYIDGSLQITSGQKSNPPPKITKSGADWKITLEADRNGSSGVASSFNNQVGGASHEYAPSGGGDGKQPDKLNFYFGVRITWNINGQSITDEAYLAQGHSTLGGNNWWIGANEVVNVGTPLFLVISNDIIRQIFRMSGGGDSFTFKPQD